MSSDFMHIVTYARLLSFSWRSNVSLYLETLCAFIRSFIHSLAHGQLGCCRVSAVVDKAAIHMGVQLSLQGPVSNLGISQK